MRERRVSGGYGPGVMGIEHGSITVRYFLHLSPFVLESGLGCFSPTRCIFSIRLKFFSRQYLVWSCNAKLQYPVMSCNAKLHHLLV